jgi:glucose uptake protein GlcU
LFSERFLTLKNIVSLVRNFLFVDASLSTVLQTYKIGVCFITSWLVLAFGVPFTFTPWGFVSGLFMVPGGTAGYFAVRNAGLAVSQGIWSSLKVLVAFGWGIFIFQEPVRSKFGTGVAVALMMAGLAGMSYFAAPSKKQDHDDFDDDVEEREDNFAMTAGEPLLSMTRSMVRDDSLSTLSDAESLFISPQPSNQEEEVVLGCLRLSYGQLGILGAIIDGAYGGSILMPMHYSRSTDTQGLAFVLSFAIGCATVVTVIWILRFLFYCQRTQSFSEGFQRLPSFHIMTIGPSAILAGLIWSVGNVSAILSVAILGQGVGYSIVQSQLLVAGLWGVFYYREIRGRRVVTSWFLFACVTVMGILLLSQEHVAEVA